MTGPAPAADRSPAFPVRSALLALAALSIAATAFELFVARHWNGVVQLIPWVALAVLAAATVLLALRPRAVTVVRVLAVPVLAAALYGVVEHALVNYGSGPLDGRYGAVWDSLPVAQRVWFAVTKVVGPSPTLAPGVLGQSALLVLLAAVTPRLRAAEGGRRAGTPPR